MKKSLDKVAQRIFAIGFSISLFTFSLLFGISTITNNPVQAEGPERVAETGKIMMSESGWIFNGNPMYHILVWNTETGKSKLYHYSRGSQDMKKANYQLPTSPLY